MGKLADKQAAFFRALTLWAFDNQGMRYDGALYRMRLDYSKRSKEENKRVGGHPRSTHLHRLAVDIILDKSLDDGVTWITAIPGDDPVWGLLHERWENYGGARMIPGDAGHFSFELEGVR